MGDPGINLPEGSALEAVDSLPPHLPALDQAGFAQDSQVVRDCGLADTEAGYQIADRVLSNCEQIEEGATVGFSHSLENSAATHELHSI